MRRLPFGLAILFSGTIPALVSPPLGWTWLHPLMWVPALWLFSRLAGRAAFLAGWAVGSLMNLVLFYWIADTVRSFTNLPALAGLAILLLFCLAFGLFVGVFAWGVRPLRRASGSLWPLGVAAWFTACEFLSPQLFPYFQGVGWYQVPRVFLVSTLTGVSGVTFLVLLVNGVLLGALEFLGSRAAPAPRRALAHSSSAAALLLLCAGVWSELRMQDIARAEARAESVRVALVQPNYDVHRHRALAQRGPGAIARDLVELSMRALREHPGIDAFVWPEKTLLGSPGQRGNRIVRDFARHYGVEVWTGGDHVEAGEGGSPRRTNAAFRVLGDGRVDRRYDKRILLPFGEFMPMRDALPFLARIEGPGNLMPGDQLVVYDSALGRFAFSICYEAILPDFVRDAAERGLDFLVNLTYDGWFGPTSEPHQHLMLAAAQAAQYGLPLARSTTTGISAFIDARGVITARTGLFSRELLVGDVKKVRVPSPYAELGDWFAWACAIASASLWALAAPARRRRLR